MGGYLTSCFLLFTFLLFSPVFFSAPASYSTTKSEQPPLPQTWATVRDLMKVPKTSRP